MEKWTPFLAHLVKCGKVKKIGVSIIGVTKTEQVQNEAKAVHTELSGHYFGENTLDDDVEARLETNGITVN